LVFPNDRALTTLVKIDPAALYERVLRERMIEGAARGGTVGLDTLRYNPERRFVGSLHANGATVATVRCYGPADFERAAGKTGSLLSRGSLRLARTVMRVARLRLLAMEWLEGELLNDALLEGGTAHESMQRVGVALAELHAQEAAGLPMQTARSDISALHAVASDLGKLCPDVAQRARALVDRLAKRLASARNVLRPVHGDFHTRQVLLQRGTVAMLDLDEAYRGDPACDVGRLGADLEHATLTGDITAQHAGSSLDALVEGYARIAGRVPRHVNLHVAAELLRLAPHPFRRREPDWPMLTEAILARAEAFLEADIRSEASIAAATRGKRPAVVSDPFNAADDPQMPFLMSALSPSAMSECLTDALRDSHGWVRTDVRRIAVIRRKPGRRCVIEYVLDAAGANGSAREVTLIGKCRARGVDATTYDLQRRLWIGSFSPAADDGVLVPEPVCVLPPLHMTVQRKVFAPSFWSLLAGGEGVRMARLAADAIAKLHRASIPARRTHGVNDEVSILRRRLAMVAEEQPSWRTRIDVLLDACGDLGRTLAPSRACGIHRDFYPDQLLADGGHVWLIDLDLYSQGDPALDVGNFAAHLDEYALRSFGDVEHWADRRRAFIERYLEHSSQAIRPAIEAYATLALVRHIAISRQFSDRRAFTGALLELCEKRLFGEALAGGESTCGRFRALSR
jgi:aminoglycoside phosphotransferase (APT) family kinase protein